MNKGLRTGFIVTGIVLAVLIVGSIIGGFLGWRGTGWGMMGPWMMGGYGGLWLMPVLMVVFWGLVIWGIVAFVRFGFSANCRHVDSALETLKNRYAHGEISKQEYEEKKKDLV
jgi:putative membrane protein